MSDEYIKTEKGFVKKEKQFRLKDWDYSSAGYYFVTIVTHDRVDRFGEIAGDTMNLNDVGKMIKEYWLGMGKYIGTSHVGTPLVGVQNANNVENTNNTKRTGTRPVPTKRTGTRPVPIEINLKIKTEYFNQSEILLDQFVIMPNHIHGIIILEENNKLKLGEIIGAFKSLTTNEYIKHVKENNWPRFEGKIWQSRYHDRIIRDEKKLEQKKEYIINNPQKWELDKNFVE